MYGFSDHLNAMPLTWFRALRQGSSRYSTCTMDIIEHTFADGVRRLTLPLATGPKHVHCYLVDGTLFDTGIGGDDVPWGDFGVERIAITHMHPDHVGGAEAAARTTGAVVHQGALDYAQCERVWGSDFLGETNVIDVHVKALRDKLGEPRLIQTVRGVGYALRES